MIQVQLLQTRRGKVRLGIFAPPLVKVDREEIWRVNHPGQATPQEVDGATDLHQATLTTIASREALARSLVIEARITTGGSDASVDAVLEHWIGRAVDLLKKDVMNARKFL